MKRFKIGINEEKIIKAIGLGVLIFFAAGSPKFSREISKMIINYGKKGFNDLLKNLKNKNVITISGEKVQLTKKGRKLLQEIELSKMKITKSNKWNGKWLVVSYDIPELYKKSRNVFRWVLENNDFAQLHKSLWVSPYDCKEEIAIFAKNLGVQNDVILMTTDRLPNQDRILELYDFK